MHAYGLHSHIRSNRWRSLFLIGTMLLMLYGIVCALLSLFGFFHIAATIGEPSSGNILYKNLPLLLYTAIAVSVGFWIWFRVSIMEQRELIGAAGGGYPIKRADNPELWNLLENMCISRGIHMPKFNIMETPAVNAFASGFSKDTYAITVTRGLLQRLNKDELEGVIGHELTHIRNGDVRLMMIALLVVGIIGFAGEFLLRNSLYSSSYRAEGNGRNSNNILMLIITLALVALAWVFSLFIKAALSRRREYLADAGAVELTKNPDAMISALRKISGKSDIQGATSGFMEMCCDSSRRGFFGFLDTHPPIEDRIKALIRYAGGSDTPSSEIPLDLLGPWDKVDVHDDEAPYEEQNSGNQPRRRGPFPLGPF